MSTQENISVVVEESITSTPSNEPSTEPSNEPVKVEEQMTPVTVGDRMVTVPLSVIVRSTNMIDALSRRGSFHANEMTDVGGLYNVLALVVNNAVNQIRAEQVLPKEGEGEGESVPTVPTVPTDTTNEGSSEESA
jgi:hypothetical protein